MQYTNNRRGEKKKLTRFMTKIINALETSLMLVQVITPCSIFDNADNILVHTKKPLHISSDISYHYFSTPILQIHFFFLFLLQAENKNKTEIVGGDYSGLSIKCHQLLTAIVSGKITDTGDLFSEGYIYAKDKDFEKYNATHYRYCKGISLYDLQWDLCIFARFGTAQ